MHKQWVPVAEGLPKVGTVCVWFAVNGLPYLGSLQQDGSVTDYFQHKWKCRHFTHWFEVPTLSQTAVVRELKRVSNAT